MATAITRIEKIQFELEKEYIICNVYIVSTEPDHHNHGNGWKHRVFPETANLASIITHDMFDYMNWTRGKFER